MTPMMLNLLTTKSKDKLVVVNDTFSSFPGKSKLKLRRRGLIKKMVYLITAIILATKKIAANSYLMRYIVH